MIAVIIIAVITIFILIGCVIQLSIDIAGLKGAVANSRASYAAARDDVDRERKRYHQEQQNTIRYIKELNIWKEKYNRAVGDIESLKQVNAHDREMYRKEVEGLRQELESVRSRENLESFVYRRIAQGLNIDYTYPSAVFNEILRLIDADKTAGMALATDVNNELVKRAQEVAKAFKELINYEE